MSRTEPLVGNVPEWTLGDRLRKARQAANVSTEAMAADIGRTVHTISNYERDATRAPLSVVKLYAMRCQVPLEWLLGEGLTPQVSISECYPRPPVDLQALLESTWTTMHRAA